jgi:hypothetical protein
VGGVAGVLEKTLHLARKPASPITPVMASRVAFCPNAAAVLGARNVHSRMPQCLEDDIYDPPLWKKSWLGKISVSDRTISLLKDSDTVCRT